MCYALLSVLEHMILFHDGLISKKKILSHFISLCICVCVCVAVLGKGTWKISLILYGFSMWLINLLLNELGEWIPIPFIIMFSLSEANREQTAYTSSGHTQGSVIKNAKYNAW